MPVYDPKHYREMATRGRRLSRITHNEEIRNVLDMVAQEFDEIAEDLETGAIEIRHRDMMPQSRHTPPTGKKYGSNGKSDPSVGED